MKKQLTLFRTHDEDVKNKTCSEERYVIIGFVILPEISRRNCHGQASLLHIVHKQPWIRAVNFIWINPASNKFPKFLIYSYCITYAFEVESI